MKNLAVCALALALVASLTACSAESSSALAPRDTGSTVTSRESIATVDILATGDADSDGDGASIVVLVIGPCVTTDGEGSVEVRCLEDVDA